MWNLDSSAMTSFLRWHTALYPHFALTTDVHPTKPTPDRHQSFTTIAYLGDGRRITGEGATQKAALTNLATALGSTWVWTDG
jgi:hypothetical protein